MKKLMRLVADSWQSMLIGLVIGLGLSLLYFSRLDTLVPGAAETEVNHIKSSLSLESITDNPLYLPHKLGIFAATKLGFTSLAAYRAVSGLFLLIGLFIFYRLASNWYSRRVTVLATLLFATSAWVLHISRLATPNIVVLGLGLFIACGVWLQKTRGSARALVGTFIVGSLLLYVPGSIWFVIALLVWKGKQFIGLAKSYGAGPLLIWAAAFLALLSPLAIAFIRQPSLIADWLLIPEKLPSIMTVATNLARLPAILTFRMPDIPVYWLGNLPILDVFSGTMLLLGLYSYRSKLSLDRSKALLGATLMSAILIAVSNDFSNITLLIPFTFLLIAQGIYYLLNEWFAVFPRNPLARVLGMAVFCVALLTACSYNVFHYMVAWPHTPATVQSFEKQL